MEQQARMLLASYGLEELLADNDVTEEAVVEKLIACGWIDIERYFEDDEL